MGTMRIRQRRKNQQLPSSKICLCVGIILVLVLQSISFVPTDNLTLQQEDEEPTVVASSLRQQSQSQPPTQPPTQKQQHKERDGWRIQPKDLYHYPRLARIVQGLEPNDLTVNVTKRQPQQEEPTFKTSVDNDSPRIQRRRRPPVVDIVTTGSQLRLEYLQGQLETWANHSYVRNYWGFSETDDIDPTCPSTIGKPNDHFRKCKRELPTPDESPLLKYFQMVYGQGTRGKPGGWLCAQTRFGQAVGRIGAEYRKRLLWQYQTNKNDNRQQQEATLDFESILPDYLFLVDDDTFVNIGLVIDELESELAAHMAAASSSSFSSPSWHPRVYAGCASFDSRVNISIPIGGYGLLLTKGSVLRLISPIFCNNNRTTTTTTTTSINGNHKDNVNNDAEYQDFQDKVCRRIFRDDLLHDTKYFSTDGMTISDLSYEFSKSPDDFCFNSDWLYAYFSNYYFLSVEPMPNFWRKDTEGFYLHSYRGNSMQNTRSSGGQCVHGSVEKCLEHLNVSSSFPQQQQPHICHYQTPESMKLALTRTSAKP